jgi:hypothetical protein
MSLNSLLIHTADVETLTETKSSAGFLIRAWGSKATGVRCRFDQLTPEAVLEFGRLSQRVTHRVYFDSDQSLTIADRLVWGGGYYEVRAVEAVYRRDPATPYLWQVDVEKRTANGGN